MRYLFQRQSHLVLNRVLRVPAHRSSAKVHTNPIRARPSIDFTPNWTFYRRRYFEPTHQLFFHTYSNNFVSAESPFGKLLNRRERDENSKDQPKTDDSPRVALTDDSVGSGEESIENDWVEDFDDDHYNQQHDSPLSEWYATKEEKFDDLSSASEEVLSSTPQNSKDMEKIITLMQDYNDFLSSFTAEIHSISDFRRANPQYPPNKSIINITHDAAAMTRKLLDHLTRNNVVQKVSQEMEVNAYKLAMTAWTNAFHPDSGDRCEGILEEYGERFGGDMNLMPTLDSYQTVLEAHNKSCSAYFSRRKKDWSRTKAKNATPAEKALGLLRILNNVHTAGDMFLKPDVKMYATALSVVKNSLLNWEFKRQLILDESDLKLELDLAVEAFNELDQMKEKIAEEFQDKKAKGGINESNVKRRYCAIQAYADCVMIASRVFIENDVNSKYAPAAQLRDLEDFISTHSPTIAELIDDGNCSSGADVAEIQHRLEKAYFCTLTSELSLAKELGGFGDLSDALMSAETSEKIFARMKQRSKESPRNLHHLFPAPKQEHYEAIVQCWGECLQTRYSTSDSNLVMAKLNAFPHDRASDILFQLENSISDTEQINGTIPSNIIWALSQLIHWPAIIKKESYLYAPMSAEKMLKRTMEQYELGRVRFQNNTNVTKMYNFVLRSYSKMHKGGKTAIERSLALLDDMERHCDQSGGFIARPDDFSFGLILRTISNSGAKDAFIQAESTLKRMGKFGLKPREKHYLAAMRAFLQSASHNNIDPAVVKSILDTVKQRYKDDTSVKPNAAIYSACVSAYAKSHSSYGSQRAVALLEELKTLYKETGDPDFRPDNVIYGAVLDSISKNGTDESVNQSMLILDEMEKNYDSKQTTVAPNRYTYTSVLHAISKSKPTNGVALAEFLMNRMDDRSRSLQDKSIRPDKVTFSVLLDILSRSRGDNVERAEKWLKEMAGRYRKGELELKPDTFIYTALINCYWKSQRRNAGIEAEKVLKQIEENYDQGDIGCKPDIFAYTSTINAYGRSLSEDKAKRVWEIYKRMKERYSNGDVSLKPNKIIVSRDVIYTPCIIFPQ